MNRIAPVVLYLLASTPLYAASFNCAKAHTKVETLVCSNAELSELDNVLHDVYQKRLKSLTDNTQFVQDQRDWLKETLAPCADAACVKLAYERRINEIGQQIDEDDQSDVSLAMNCDFSPNPASPMPLVSIAGALYGQGKPAGIKDFSKNTGKPQHVSFVVQPGQFAECVYPSGFRVRVKVGRGVAHPYGMCGADPEIYLSLWVNKRKVASSVWFAGHCRERSTEQPSVAYKIFGKPCPLSGDKKLDPDIGGEVCADGSEVSHKPIDLVEYPEPGMHPPKPGDIVLAEGASPMCKAILSEIAKKFLNDQLSDKSDAGDLSQPAWGDLTEPFPQQSKEATGDENVLRLFEDAEKSESTYDFDNDGKLDRVIRLSFMTHYMDGDVLLVQPGTSAASLQTRSPLSDNATMFIPCQVTGKPADFRECPPFIQKYDEAGFAFESKTGQNAFYFRARYSRVTPLLYKGASYILVGGATGEDGDYTALLKPVPGRKFQHVCLFKKVIENF